MAPNVRIDSGPTGHRCGPVRRASLKETMPSTVIFDAASLLTLVKSYLPGISAETNNGRLVLNMPDSNLSVDIGQFNGQANITFDSLRIAIDDLAWRDGQAKATFQISHNP